MKMKKRSRKLIFVLLCIVLITSFLGGCSPRSTNALDIKTGEDEKKEVKEKSNPDIESETGSDDSSLVLIDHFEGARNGDGRSFHKLVITGGENEIVKNVIDSNMQNMEQTFINNNAAGTYVSVHRNDGFLVSYECNCYKDMNNTNYNKTINVENGRELKLSDIITDMEMLPRAMYAECPAYRGDYDEFIQYIQYLLEEDEIYWTVNNQGIILTPSSVLTAALLSKGLHNPVNRSAITVYLSYEKYSQMMNDDYFSANVEKSMTVLPQNAAAFTDELKQKLKNTCGKEMQESSSMLCYAPDREILLYVDDILDYNSISLSDLSTGNNCTVDMGEGVSILRADGYYWVEIGGNKYFVYSMAYENKTGKNGETFVFKVDSDRIELTDRVSGIINLGGGRLSSEGFYMNSFEEEYLTGLDSSEWDKMSLFKLTADGKIIESK